MSDEVEESSDDRARFAVFVCVRLVQLNYGMVVSGCPVKMYVDMTSEKDNHDYLRFLRLVNDEKLLNLEELRPFLYYK